jgi:hypothetical protein
MTSHGQKSRKAENKPTKKQRNNYENTKHSNSISRHSRRSTGARLLFASASGTSSHSPPDGGYNYGNTAEGDSALLNVTPFPHPLTLGDFNTTIGYFSVSHTTTGALNTAIGYESPYNNVIRELKYGDRRVSAFSQYGQFE